MNTVHFERACALIAEMGNAVMAWPEMVGMLLAAGIPEAIAHAVADDFGR